MTEFVANPTTGNHGVDIAHDVLVSASPPAPPPGYFMYSWSRPIPVVYEGWLLNGSFTPTGDQNGLQLTAWYPPAEFIPESAGDPPGDNYRYTVVRVAPPGGWLSDIEGRYGW